MKSRFFNTWLQFFISFTLASIVIGYAVATFLAGDSEPSDSFEGEKIDLKFFVISFTLEAVLSFSLCYVFFYKNFDKSKGAAASMTSEE